jgi:hypothetical protein
MSMKRQPFRCLLEGEMGRRELDRKGEERRRERTEKRERE